MNPKLKPAAFGVIGFALVLALAIGWVGSQSAAAQAPGQKAEQFYKNIKVLNGMDANLMQPTMQLMEIALGVHCVYCHDDNAQRRDLDTKPVKQVARQMLQMVADINRTQFGGRNVVTCITCHRGSTKPDTLLPYNGEEARVTRAVPGPTPTVDQLIDRHTAALGGAENLAKVSSRLLKGTLTNMGHLDQVHQERAYTTRTPVEFYFKGPDKRQIVTKNIGGDNLVTFSGTSGWNKANPAAAAVDMRADQLEVARLESIVVFPGQIKQLLTDLRVVGEEKVGENSTWVVSGKARMLPVVKLYFDKESGILLSTLYEQQSYFCCHVFRIDYDDYWPTNGVRMPSRWTINGPREAILVYEINDVQVNTPVEDSRFVKPGPSTAAR
jgi:outer membrane lipoprotein-sorting protein